MRLHELSALELGRAIRRGEVSIPEVTEWALQRAGDNAFITLTGEQAMERAKDLQARLGEGNSPLYGVPMALKDNLCTRGIATTCGSRMLADFVPPYSATVVEWMEDAGAVSMGKTNMDEFAMGSTGETSCFGPVPNPWDSRRTTGGSSSGSAAAVAGGCCWFALGSDTGGSVRLPAAHCGLTAIRPTYGTVSRYGLVAHASSMDQVGPLCRDAADCGAVLDVIRRPDRRDAVMLRDGFAPVLEGLDGEVEGLRLGFPLDWLDEGLDEDIRRAVWSVAEGLRGQGVHLVELHLPVREDAVAAYDIISCAEAASNLARCDGVRFGHRAPGAANLEQLYTDTRSQGFGAEAKRRILLGTFWLSASDCYGRAMAVRGRLKEAFDAVFAQCDALLTPVSSTTAPLLGEGLGDPGDGYTVPASLVGLPALSMPCGMDRNGLPVGAQLMGRPWGEQTILKLAHAWQRETDWHRRRPERGAV